MVNELNKLQDTISHIKLENSVKSIELYDPNNPEFLQKKISKQNSFLTSQYLNLVLTKVTKKKQTRKL